jgi:hypothetical protein
MLATRTPARSVTARAERCRSCPITMASKRSPDSSGWCRWPCHAPAATRSTGRSPSRCTSRRSSSGAGWPRSWETPGRKDCGCTGYSQAASAVAVGSTRLSAASASRLRSLIPLTSLGTGWYKVLRAPRNLTARATHPIHRAPTPPASAIGFRSKRFDSKVSAVKRNPSVVGASRGVGRVGEDCAGAGVPAAGAGSRPRP